MFKTDLMDQQEVFIPGKWFTKGLPTGGDYGFIPGPAAWESSGVRALCEALRATSASSTGS